MAPNVLRRAGMLERYHIARVVGKQLDTCVVVSAKFVNNTSSPLTTEVIYPALRVLVETKHAALGVGFVDEASSKPGPGYFRLESVDLTKIVSFVDKDEFQLGEVYEEQLRTPIDHSAGLPKWRVVVLKDNTVLFAMHHGIGDGLSCLAFHRDFLAALRSSLPPSASPFCTPGPDLVLSPTIEEAANLDPPLSKLGGALWELLAPDFLNPHKKTWTGRDVGKKPDNNTKALFLTFSGEDIAKFSEQCRKHKATVTPSLHLIAVSVLCKLLREDSTNKRFSNILTYIPYALRRHAGLSMNIMGDYASVYHLKKSLEADGFSWDETSKLSATLKTHGKAAAQDLGMLKFLYGQYEAFWSQKLGRKREGSFEMSNLGRFDTGVDLKTDPSGWRITSTGFAQSESYTGCAIKLNTTGDGNGGVTFVATWNPASVDADLVTAFVGRFKDAFYELLEESKVT